MRHSLSRRILDGLGMLAALAMAHPALAQSWAGGADVSWVSQQESAGQIYRSANGTKTDPFVLLKGQGINAIRLRVWVNPNGGWCNGADVLYKAKRAVAQGQSVMIDFHYSDTFADPGKQTIRRPGRTIRSARSAPRSIITHMAS